jgi:ribonucleotide monophosphatase NagD (HAD superfamily)
VPSITFERAWQEYRAAEPRLPAKPPPVVPERVAGIGAILDRFDLVILDAWGVLNRGDTPIPSARAAVAAMRASGMLVAVLSNDASAERQVSVATHRRRGFPFAPDEIVAGLDLLPETLERLALRSPVGLIADSPVSLQALTGPMVRLGDDRTAYDRVSGCVFLSSDGWTEARQALLQESLARAPRPLIVCNPDIASPGRDLLNAEPGYFAIALRPRPASSRSSAASRFPRSTRR